MSLRALIVDDELLARERLCTLLQQEEDVKVVGECANGMSAIREIKCRTPDVVLLDIQLPEMDGFQVVEALGNHPHIEVIFVTAYDQFALRAFKARALDYLLKPVEGDGLREALSRVRERLDPTRAVADRQIAREETIRIKCGSDILFLRPEEIDWVESAGCHVCFHLGSRAYISRQTMQQAERDLGAHGFLRIHRGAIVNLQRITKLKLQSYGDYALELADGTVRPVGRDYRDPLLATLRRRSSARGKSG